MSWTRIHWLGGVSLGLVACNLLLGNEQGEVADGIDATDLEDAGRSPEGPLDAAPDAVVGPPPEEGCEIVYVSPNGTDGASVSGCSKAQPRKSLTRALYYVQAFFPDGPKAIHLCEGRYDDSLTIGIPISMVGGFDCDTFEPASADRASVLRGLPGEAPTLTVSGEQVDATARIERLRVEGPDQPEDSALESIAIRVQGGARPVLSDLQVQAGSAPGRAVGVEILHSAPVLERSVVESGHSACTHANLLAGVESGGFRYGRSGNIGVYVITNGPGPAMRGNTIVGGRGAECPNVAPSSSVGVLLNGGRYTQSDGNAFTGNTVAAYQELPNDEPPSMAAALVTSNSALEIVGSHLSYGDRVTRDTNPALPAIYRGRDTVIAVDGEALLFRHSRIVGAEIDLAAPPPVDANQEQHPILVRVRDVKRVEVTDSLLLGLEANAQSRVSSTRVLQTNSFSDADIVVRHSTLVFGRVGGKVNYGVVVTRSESNAQIGVEIEHNLLLSREPGQGIALWLDEASKPWVIRGNTFGPMWRLTSTALGNVEALGQPEARWDNQDNAQMLRANASRACTDGLPCVSSDCEGDACVAEFFAPASTVPGVDAGSFRELAARMRLDGPGWRLSEQLPCALARRPGGEVGFDLAGHPRGVAGAVSSPGAYEATSCDSSPD